MTSDGTALAGDDYVSSTETLTWQAGDTAPKDCSVPILTDDLVELDESFAVTLSNPTGGASVGAPDAATVTILGVVLGDANCDSAVCNLFDVLTAVDQVLGDPRTCQEAICQGIKRLNAISLGNNMPICRFPWDLGPTFLNFLGKWHLGT